MRNTCIDTIIKQCASNKDIFFISGDAGLGVFDDFKKKYPHRFLNMGVAEQNMMSFSAGLCLAGFNVYVYDIIPFLLFRCYEQVRNDVCYQRLPMTLVGIGSGVTYAPGGMTHYSVEDIGIAQTLPNLTVISPSDPVEARLAAEYSLNAAGPVYIRLAKRGEPSIHTKKTFNILHPQIIKQGSQVALVFHGSASIEAIQAYELLSKKGITPMLVSIPTLQPLDSKKLLTILQPVDHVISIEEHYVNCGLGNILSTIQAQYQPDWKVTSLGIPYHFIHEIKDTVHMRDHFGFSAKEIVKTVSRFV